jgi:hypothetical protein
MASLLRRIAGTLSGLLLAFGLVAALAGPAHAEDGYRYWNYFHLQGDTWAFSEVGPADYQPEDGDVEGFRFGTSTVSDGLEPRADLDEVTFEAVCADSEAAAAQKRVAVVLDFGNEEAGGERPEPRAECAVVAQDASTQQALQQVTDVRLDGGMTCALDGYPATGCGEPVADAQVPADEEPVAFAMPSAEPADTDAAGSSESTTQDSGLPWGVVGIAALVVVIGVAALVLARRRSA